MALVDSAMTYLLVILPLPFPALLSTVMGLFLESPDFFAPSTGVRNLWQMSVYICIFLSTSGATTVVSKQISVAIGTKTC